MDDSKQLNESASATPDLFDDLATQLGEAYAMIVFPNYTKKEVKAKPIKDQGIALIEKLKPRDDIERMLIGQLLLAHARNMHLSRKVLYHDNLDVMKMMHSAADDACTTFRKTLDALRQHRRPKRRRRTSFTAIRTAHISARQIVGKKKKRIAIEAKTKIVGDETILPRLIDLPANDSGQ